jgi:small subunit ribosomal protein S1
LARDRSDQRLDRFAPGDKVDARVTNIDRAGRKISVSIKALEIKEQKEAMAQYGSSDSGASLGDILGAAIKTQAEQERDGDEAAAEADKASAEEPAADESEDVASGNDSAGEDEGAATGEAAKSQEEG